MLCEKTRSSPSRVFSAETQCDINPTPEPTASSHQATGSMEEEKQESTLSGAEASEESLQSGCAVEPFRKDAQRPAAFSVSVDKPELPSMDYRPERSQCQDLQSPSTTSPSADAQDALSAMDVDARLLPQSEEEDEDEDDEQMKGHHLDIKQELQAAKPELLLDEMSSSSGFLGSPGEPDNQLAMELGLVPAGRSHGDNLTETDDSLPFDALRSDREKVKRRGSPGRSRVKQVRSPWR